MVWKVGKADAIPETVEAQRDVLVAPLDNVDAMAKAMSGADIVYHHGENPHLPWGPTSPSCRAPASGFVTKPLVMHTFARKVRSALDGAQASGAAR